MMTQIREVKLTVSQGLSTTSITNNGSTLTVGDEATVSGGAGARWSCFSFRYLRCRCYRSYCQCRWYRTMQNGDTITFSSGTAEAKVSVVGGGLHQKQEVLLFMLN